MVTVLLIVLGCMAVLGLAVLIAARELELRNERWDEYRHPPDSEVKFHDEQR